MPEFIRARRADQKDLRRRALLKAAAQLFDAGGSSGAGLNAIAAHAGFTKSNVYRYFESREDVLLSLFLEDFGTFSDAVAKALAGCAPGDVADLSRTMTSAFTAAPRLCRLAALFGSVLEQNVSVARVEGVKTTLAALIMPIVTALASRLPGSTERDCGWAFSMTMALLAGMWPGVEPSRAAAEVLAKPQFSHMVLHLDEDLRRAVEALLRSISRT